MKITFKNVGQGDTIILEWINETKKEFAIIDCNKFENVNPALEFIIENKITEIRYLILSHPHSDHFSGFYELLKYCEKNNIVVKYFLHTCEVVPDYLKGAVKSIAAQKELLNLFQYLKLLEGNTIAEICFLSAHSLDRGLVIPINNDYEIKVLAPSSVEKHNYIRKTYTEDEEDPNNNAHANWLSTLLKISSEKNMVLLTSDVEKKVFQRLNSMNHEFEKKLVLAQFPHHGAKKNMLKHFWNKLNHDNCPIVFSVGKNGYGHPSKEVLEYLEKWHFEIYTTNQVSTSSNEENLVSSLLNMFSTEMTENFNKDKTNADQAFILS